MRPRPGSGAPAATSPLLFAFLCCVLGLVSASAPINPSAANASANSTARVRGKPHLDPLSIALAATGVLFGVVYLLRGYRLPPRLTMFVTGGVYFGTLGYACGLVFTASVTQVVAGRLGPAASVALLPLGVGLLMSLLLVAIPPRMAQPLAPLLIAAVLSLILHAATLPYPSVPSWMLLALLAVNSVAVAGWSRVAFRGAVTFGTSLTGAWIAIVALDLVINRGVVYEFVARYSDIGGALPTDGMSRIAVWLEIAATLAMAIMGWMIQLVRFQGPWIESAFDATEGNRGKKKSWVGEGEGVENDRYLMNA